MTTNTQKLQKIETFIDINDKITWHDFYEKYSKDGNHKLHELLSDFNKVAAILYYMARGNIIRKCTQNGSNEIILVETSLIDFYVSIKDMFVTIEGKKQSVKDLIVSNTLMLSYSYSVFQPYCSSDVHAAKKIMIDKRLFNYFQGFQAHEIPLSPSDDKLLFLFDNIKNEFVIDNIDFDYIINWFAHLIQHPNCEDVPPLVFCINLLKIDMTSFSGESILEWICNSIIGKRHGLDLCETIKNSDKIRHKSLVICPEKQYKKDLCKKTFELKYARFIVYSQKRNWLSCKMIPIRCVSDKLNSLLTDELANIFYTYLLRKDIAHFNVKIFSYTKYTSPLEHFLITYKWSRFPLLTETLHEEYNEWCKVMYPISGTLNIIKFTRDLSYYGSLVSKTIGNANKTVCMPITTSQLDLRYFVNIPRNIELSKLKKEIHLQYSKTSKAINDITFDLGSYI